MYQCQAGSVEGFVRQLAVGYVAHEYWFYVTGTIPVDKVPEKVDQKIIERYQLDLSRWTRARRKKLGFANVQYLRFGRFFVIIATHGVHPFFELEAKSIRDIRRHPVRFHAYSIGYRHGWGDHKWHASVRLTREYFRALKDHFDAAALRCSAEELAATLHRLPVEPWAPVRRQLISLLHRINRRRKAAGFSCVPFNALDLQHRPSKPFAAQ